MVFKNIDGQLTTVFNKTKEVGLGFNFASKELNAYRETIQGYLFDFLFAGTSNLNRYCHGFGLKIEPQSMLRKINRESELFKSEALNDNLKDFLKEFNRLMGLDEE